MELETPKTDTPAIDGEIPALKDAPAVGVQVKATSADSRYVCVLRSPELNMATRIFPYKVSLRIEPRASIIGNVLAERLQQLGFVPHDGGAYSSLHVDVGNYGQAVMTACAMQAAVMNVLLSVGTPFWDADVEVLSFKDIFNVPGKSV